MKIEKRGKYAGVKVHLEPDEVEPFIQVAKDYAKTVANNIKVQPNYLTLSVKLGKKISQLLLEEPDLLKDRTPDQIQHELEVELESAQKKLAAITKGKNWKEIHVK